MDSWSLTSLNQTGGKRLASRQQKALDIMGEETAAILEAHPELTSSRILKLVRHGRLDQVWIKPHCTMPESATLWGALGYSEKGEKLKGAVLRRRQRQEKEELEAKEAEERRLEKVAEMEAKRVAARDERVAKLDAWLKECAKDPNFIFPHSSALARFLAHATEDGRPCPFNLKGEYESGENSVVQDFFMANAQTSKVSLPKVKKRVALLEEIVRLSDGEAKLLSSSACAKQRLFWHIDSKDESRAASIVKELNLNDDRVSRLDAWLKTEAQLSFFKDAASVKAWMDDFGPDSAKRWSISDWCENQIVGDFFMNLGNVRCTSPVLRRGKWLASESQSPGNTTLDAVKTHLQKLQQVLELCNQMPPVAKLRLCSDFKRYAAKAPADIVSDADLKNNRHKQLDKWLNTKQFDAIKSGKQLLQWIQKILGNDATCLPLVQDFFHKPEANGLPCGGRTIRLSKTLAELKADCRWLNALFRALSKKELDALNGVAAHRLLAIFPTNGESTAKPEVAMAIVDLDLRCNREKRLNAWMAAQNLEYPSATAQSCSNGMKMRFRANGNRVIWARSRHKHSPVVSQPFISAARQ